MSISLKLPSFGSGSKAKLIVIPVVIVLIVVAVVAFLPYWAGGKLKAVYVTYGEAIGAEPTVTVKETSFKRGWLSSTATGVYEFSSGSPFTVQVSSTDEISHGFSTVKAFLGGGDPKTSVKSTVGVSFISGGVEAFALPQINADLLVSRSGDFSGTFTSKRYEPGAGMPLPLDWGGFNGEIEYAMENKRVKAVFRSLPISVATPKGNFKISRLKYDVNARMGGAGVMVGTAGFGIGSIDIVSGTKTIGMKDFKISATVDSSGENMGIAMKYSLGEFKKDDEVHGPAAMEFVVKNIDAATFAKIQEVSAKIRGSAMGGGKPDKAMQKELKGLLLSLTKKVPRFELNGLSVKTAYGNIAGSLNAVLDGSKVDLAEKPMLIPTVLNVGADLTLSASLLHRSFSPEQVAGTGFFVRNGDDYRTSVSYSGGRLMINGKPADKEKMAKLGVMMASLKNRRGGGRRPAPCGPQYPGADPCASAPGVVIRSTPSLQPCSPGAPGAPGAGDIDSKLEDRFKADLKKLDAESASTGARPDRGRAVTRPSKIAGFYTWEDENGVVHFTDSPHQIPESYTEDMMASAGQKASVFPPDEKEDFLSSCASTRLAQGKDADKVNRFCDCTWKVYEENLTYAEFQNMQKKATDDHDHGNGNAPLLDVMEPKMGACNAILK